MSQTANIAEQFDRISHIYDETREPLKKSAVDKIKNIFLRDDCSSIIEVGVGTGRARKAWSRKPTARTPQNCLQKP